MDERVSDGAILYFIHHSPTRANHVGLQPVWINAHFRNNIPHLSPYECTNAHPSPTSRPTPTPIPVPRPDHRTAPEGHPQPLEYGQLLWGAFNKPNQVDLHTIVAGARDRVVFRVTRISGKFQPKLIVPPCCLYSCRALVPGLIAGYDRLVCEVPISGTYSILVDGLGHNGTGEYIVNLQRLNDPIKAEPLIFGQTLSGVLGPGEVDVYNFDAAEGDRVKLSVSRLDGGLNALSIQYFGPSSSGFRLLCGFPVRSPGVSWVYQRGEASEDCELKESGTHTILVEDLNRFFGHYSLLIERLP